MAGLAAISPSDLWSAAAVWTIAHSFWQAAILLIATSYARRRVPSGAARVRVGVATLVVFVLGQMVTFAVVSHAAGAAYFAPTDLIETSLRDLRHDGMLRRIALPSHEHWAWVRHIDLATRYVLAAWIVLMVLWLVRCAGGLLVIRSLCRRAVPLEASRRSRYQQLAAELGVDQFVAFAESDQTNVPMVAGVREHTVLVPPKELLPLTEQQMEAIILHELAHVRRGDFAANAIRTLVASVCCFNPFIWWLNKSIANDVEMAADQLAADVLGDRPRYADALHSLVRLRVDASGMAMGAGGGSLRSRIEAVLTTMRPSRASGLSTLVGVATGAAFVMALCASYLTTVAHGRRDAAWAESRDLGWGIVDTLSHEGTAPQFDAAMELCLSTLRTADAVDEASLARLADALSTTVSSRSFYDALTETGMRNGRSDFGRLGTLHEVEKIDAALLADLHQPKQVRAGLVLAALFSIGDDGVALRKLIRRPDVVRSAELTAVEYYRLQLVSSAFEDRLPRMTRKLAALANVNPSPAEAEAMLDDLKQLPSLEAALVVEPSREICEALEAAADRLGQPQSLSLIRISHPGAAASLQPR